ncbi:MAG: MFS transporter [Ruminococcus sp.]|nr:MFS transporter [Ruminococcus sp.]
MTKSGSYRSTITSCFMGYVVQAIVNNLAPLLFLTFRSEFSIPLSKITFLITFNFGIQLLVDLISPTFVDKIGYRASMLAANAFCIAGLSLMTVLPAAAPTPFVGLIICVMLYAVGGGLLEVLVSPIVEACPTDNKETAMSMLHSFYCWGQVAVVALSTLFFHLAGISHWRLLPLLWAAVPLADFIMFLKVPVPELSSENGQRQNYSTLFKNRTFIRLMLMMLCAGACELTVSQWASTFAEAGLHVSKTFGDLLGPMLFAVLMGTSRAIFGVFGERMQLRRFMLGSAALCTLCYAVISLSQSAVLGLAACAVCGFSVGIFWPGTFSLGAASIKNGGTLMFALFALAGDLGCQSGPTLAGETAALFGDDLHKGMLFAMIFPVLMLVLLLTGKRSE